MIVGKDISSVINSNIMVDKWSVNYTENVKTGKDDLKEMYCGMTEVEKLITKNT